MLVIIKIYNCIHIIHIIFYYILLKCCKEKEPKDEQLCIAVHTINNNIHDANPLDNLSTKAQLGWHWGLIWDFKNKTGDPIN